MGKKASKGKAVAKHSTSARTRTTRGARAKAPRCAYEGPSGTPCSRKAADGQPGALCTLHARRAQSGSGKFMVELIDTQSKKVVKHWGPYRASKANSYIAALAEKVDPKRYRITRAPN